MFLKNRTFFVKMAVKMFSLFKVKGARAAFEIYCWSRSRIISGRLRFPGIYNSIAVSNGGCFIKLLPISKLSWTLITNKTTINYQI